jgi:DNA-binding beta-propeller fold protein YncE
MKRKSGSKTVLTTLATTAALLATVALVNVAKSVEAAGGSIPKFEADPYWPKPLPNNWILGEVSGVSVDSRDHVWIIHRPRTTSEHDRYAADGKGDCCVPAPAVIEFDPAGNVVQAWGGPGQGYEWPDNEHGVFVDAKDNVWVGGNGDKGDAQILKFTRAGKFLMQIGRHGQSKGSNDTANLGRPAGIVVWAPTNEVFVADGYGNRRVIVYDGETGAYKRHWGAYGNKPDDAAPRTRFFEGPGAPQFNLVHGIRISNDGLVYVGDRVNNRVQVFKLDGTFVKEGYIERKTSGSEGTAFDVAFSPDKQQRFFYVPDGTNKKIQIVDRQTLEILGFVGGHGGHGALDFYHIHSIATDSKGNIYMGEVNAGRRALRYAYKGMSK